MNILRIRQGKGTKRKKDKVRDKPPERQKFYNCKYCTAIFYADADLSKHVNILHKDKFSHKCTQCSFSTRNMIQYTIHCKEKHDNCVISPEDELIPDSEQVNTTLLYKL